MARVMRLKGKTALISGASRNIGKAIALNYAREGADLILVARENASALDDVAAQCKKLGVEARAILADVGDSAQVEKAVQEGLGHFGKLDRIGSLALDNPDGLDLVGQPGALTAERLGLFGIIPEGRVLDPGVQLIETAQRDIPVKDAS